MDSPTIIAEKSANSGFPFPPPTGGRSAFIFAFRENIAKISGLIPAAGPVYSTGGLRELFRLAAFDFRVDVLDKRNTM